MNKICGYSCEHNKSGVCQIPVCDKRLIISDKTEIKHLSKSYYDLHEKYYKLQQENKQLKIQISAREEVCNRLESNWNKLKECIKECLEAIDTIQKLTGNAIENYTPRILTYRQILDKMQELEGSDSNGQ